MTANDDLKKEQEQLNRLVMNTSRTVDKSLNTSVRSNKSGLDYQSEAQSLADETRDFILNGNKSGYVPKNSRKKKRNKENVVIQETVTRRIISGKPKGMNATTNKKKNRKNALSTS